MQNITGINCIKYLYGSCALIVVFIFGISNLSAQRIAVISHLDTNYVRIGDQAQLIFDIKNLGKNQITFPSFGDSIAKIEIVNKTIDTLKDTEGKQTIRQKLLITSFDSGSFVIPSYTFYIRTATDSLQDSILSEPVTFYVKGIAVDTSKEIKDIKPPLDVPFSLKEFLKEYGLLIGGGLLVVIAAIVLYYWLKKRKAPIVPEKAVPLRPAHLTALEELEKLDKQRLWQQGEFKEYHSRISDILRTYIEQRFKFNAPELTTDEILLALKHLSAAHREMLYQVLYLSDMVKFAKAQPIPVENENSIVKAKEFVNVTKQETQTDNVGEEAKI